MCLSGSDTSATRNGKPFATGEMIVRLERIVALRGGRWDERWDERRLRDRGNLSDNEKYRASHVVR